MCKISTPLLDHLSSLIYVTMSLKLSGDKKAPLDFFQSNSNIWMGVKFGLVAIHSDFSACGVT